MFIISSVIQIIIQINVVVTLIFTNIHSNPGHQIKQAERIKSRKRRPEVDRLNGQLAEWSIGLMVDRLDGQ